MTSPSPGDSSQPNAGDSSQPAPASSGKRSAKVDVLSVGQFTHRDHLLNREHTGLGVVVKVGDVLTVRPLAGHTVQVDPANFTSLAADDV